MAAGWPTHSYWMHWRLVQRLTGCQQGLLEGRWHCSRAGDTERATGYVPWVSEERGGYEGTRGGSSCSRSFLSPLLRPQRECSAHAMLATRSVFHRRTSSSTETS